MGTNDITKDKDGNIKLVGNEYNLLEWMKKNDCISNNKGKDKCSTV